MEPQDVRSWKRSYPTLPAGSSLTEEELRAQGRLKWMPTGTSSFPTQTCFSKLQTPAQVTAAKLWSPKTWPPFQYEQCPPLTHVWLFATPWTVAPRDSSVHATLQAGILEWVAIPFSRGSSQPGDRTWVSHTAGRLFTVWATREAHPHLPGKPIQVLKYTQKALPIYG